MFRLKSWGISRVQAHRGAAVLLTGLTALTMGCGGTTSTGAPSGGQVGAGGSGAGGSGAGGLGAGGLGAGGSGAGGLGAGAGGHTGPGQGVGSATKVDLLFMIDNSSSMADKQSILSRSVGELVSRLVDPICVGALDPTTNLATRAAADSAGNCPTGLTREFAPINDIHVGVVSSSLGSMGADACIYDQTSQPSPQNNPSLDDHGHLLARASSPGDFSFSMQVPAYVNNTGVPDNFLAWDPGAAATPPKPVNDGAGQDTSAATIANKFSSIVVGVAQSGCGFEQQMESWYRFLVDPSPPSSVVGGVGANGPLGPTIGPIDTALLRQRADFLRPDSLVSVVVISDENEHSVILGTLPAQVCETPEMDQAGNLTGNCTGSPSAWPAAYRISDNFDASGVPHQFNFAALQIEATPESAFPVWSGTAACASDPYSANCKDCLTMVNGVGQLDPSCVQYGDTSKGMSQLDNIIDLRQWDMKRRFGWDAEYPVQRYVDGLHEVSVYDTSFAAKTNGQLAFKVTNPLFDDLPYSAARAAGKPLSRAKMPARDPKLVVLTAIVGVPWQDITNLDPTTMKPSLAQGYMTSDKVSWSLIVGDPYNTDPTQRDPGDPLMLEAQNRDAAIAKVGGKHPITGEALGHDTWNSINGHEWNAYQGADLQYTCFVALPAPTDCGTMGDCDCTSPDGGSQDPSALQALNNPLCEPLTDPSNEASPGKGQAAITGAAAFMQYRAHAYSGRRYLQVLKGLSDAGGNVVVASICATNAHFDDPAHANDPDLGYRPAVDAIVERLKPQLAPP